MDTPERANYLSDSMEEKGRAKAARIRGDLEQDKTTIKKLKEWGITEDITQNLIKGVTKPDDIFDDISEKISKHVGQLFYYPKIDPSKMHEYEISGEKAKWAVSEEEWQDVMERKKYNQGTKPRKNDPEILYQLAGRHLVLTFNCFAGLSYFSVINQKQITDDFLQNSVLDEQGWNHKLSTKPSTDKPENLKSLQDGIRDMTTLDYQNGIFYTNDSTKNQNILTQSAITNIR